MDQTSFTWAGLRAGAVAGAPFTAGVLPYGIAFGALAGQAGLDLQAGHDFLAAGCAVAVFSAGRALAG